MSNLTCPKPRLPAAARKAGATTISRCDRKTFAVGFKIHGEDLDAPGNGPAVMAALCTWAGQAGFTVSWRGMQKFGIILEARNYDGSNLNEGGAYMGLKRA